MSCSNSIPERGMIVCGSERTSTDDGRHLSKPLSPSSFHGIPKGEVEFRGLATIPDIFLFSSFVYGTFRDGIAPI